MSRLSKLELSPTALVAALLGTLVVLAGATWFVILAPKRNESSSLASQIQVAKASLAVGGKTVGHQGSRLSQSVFVRRAFPDTVAMPQLVLELSRVAGEERVSLDSITPTTPTPYSGFSSVPMTVIVTGRYVAIEGFLRQIRNLVRVEPGLVYATGRLFDVSGISLKQAPNPPAVSATLTMSAFVYSGVAQGIGISENSGAST